MKQPSAFIVPSPDGERTMLWVMSPSGHFMLLAGSWMFRETARLFATRCGYRLISSEVGRLAVEHQMNERADHMEDGERIH